MRRLVGFGVLLLALVGATAAPAEPAGDPVDLNRASEVELTRLPGIGAKKARAIVDERLRGGPFQSVDDLERVRGIGPATIDRLRPFARAGAAPRIVEPPDGPVEVEPRREKAAARPRPRPTARAAARPKGPPVNVNVAGLDELAALPGLDHALAQVVVRTRPHRDLAGLAAATGLADASALEGRVSFQVNVNRATIGQLSALGIPSDAAARVVELRERVGPFEGVDELASVPGIRPELVEALAPYLVAR